MKFSKIEAGYISQCGNYLIEKTDYTTKGEGWRLTEVSTGDSELCGTKKECVELAVNVECGACGL